MKKLMALMLGVTLALGSVAVTFAQTQKEQTKKEKKTKAPKAKKTTQEKK